MSEFKGKERTDKVSERLYHKDFNSLVKSYSKINALATALKEAEEEIERLANELETREDKCTLHGVMPSLPQIEECIKMLTAKQRSDMLCEYCSHCYEPLDDCTCVD